VPWTYRYSANLPVNAVSYAGAWVIGSQRIVAGLGARLRLHFLARYVYVVLGGQGTVQVLVNGRPQRTLTVNADKLYTAVTSGHARDAVLELRFSPGVTGYSFTFG